jgi:hypothetical protein
VSHEKCEIALTEIRALSGCAYVVRQIVKEHE